MDIRQLANPQTLVSTSAGEVTVKYPNTSHPLVNTELDDQDIGMQLILTNCQISTGNNAISSELFSSLPSKDQAAIAQALLNFMNCELESEAGIVAQIGAAAKLKAKARAKNLETATTQVQIASAATDPAAFSTIAELNRQADQARADRERLFSTPDMRVLNPPIFNNNREEQHNEQMEQLAAVNANLAQLNKSAEENGIYQKIYNSKMFKWTVAGATVGALGLFWAVWTAQPAEPDKKAELSTNTAKSSNLTTADKSVKATGKPAASDTSMSTASGTMPAAKSTAAAPPNK